MVAIRTSGLSVRRTGAGIEVAALLTGAGGSPVVPAKYRPPRRAFPAGVGGKDTALYDLPAFAKGGRERHGISPNTRAHLDACRAERARHIERPLPLTARAARAYLDVCFFHPFGDGNARSPFPSPSRPMSRRTR